MRLDHLCNWSKVLQLLGGRYSIKPGLSLMSLWSPSQLLVQGHIAVAKTMSQSTVRALATRTGPRETRY